MEKKRKKPLTKRWWFWVLVIVLVFFVVDFVLSDPDYVPENERIYTEVTVDQLYEELSDNTLRAEDEYENTYAAVTGLLRVIESDYISIYPLEYESLDAVHCLFTDDEQRERIMECSKGDTITVKGQLYDVGGTFGYKMRIDSIE